MTPGNDDANCWSLQAPRPIQKSKHAGAYIRFRVWGLSLRVWGLRSGVQGLGITCSPAANGMVDSLTVRFKGAPPGCCCWASSPSLRMNSPPPFANDKDSLVFARQRWRCLVLEGGRWVLNKNMKCRESVWGAGCGAWRK